MIVLIARDMRERKAQEQRLRDLNAALQSARDAAQAANDAKTSFVTQMSHALRTPLAAILGYAEMMTEDAPQALSDDLARVHIAATTLLDLVDDVLDLARIEAGAMELSSDYIELEDLASQLVDTVKPLMRGGSLTIDFIDCGNYDVRIIDDTNTECVLQNLSLCFDNADWIITDNDLANCGFQ